MRKAMVIAGISAILGSFTQSASADVRVLHLSPDAPPVDILVGTSEMTKAPLVTDFAYGSISPYVPVPTGNYFIDVIPSGTTTPVIDVNGIGIDGAVTYSIAAVNVVAAIEPLVLIDDNTINPAAARVRIVHASPNAGAVDISVQGLGVVAPGVNFKDATPYLEVPEGTYTIDVLEAGTSNVVFTVPDLPLNAGTVYSAFAAGLVGETGDQAFRVIPSVDAVPEPTAMPFLLLGGLAMWAGSRRSRQGNR